MSIAVGIAGTCRVWIDDLQVSRLALPIGPGLPTACARSETNQNAIGETV